ncbi:hypothetical protein SERLA73DRAFT_121094 [Serpula lacrymans var. lacrymans S7.3]|uniref:Uncharacterized protein n=2 Tax=Serpula lacrymans var. lacrymans TaxID=341189 RepID=F8PRY2_SERL3|nr:uncharacterized protein SERLADRAFT_367802 [Serpula lacrymans var. lacrymans S7.9]EGO00648.1 hypothetical protein SERLA73DRAFT_121094 [Serpula lacrymans var. lacrymans S7.3]EGO26203.1 hypothetical protein SERLADRAFT_367802 [Serpula lacrymans var. lacrymans S7.9]
MPFAIMTYMSCACEVIKCQCYPESGIASPYKLPQAFFSKNIKLQQALPFTFSPA